MVKGRIEAIKRVARTVIKIAGSEIDALIMSANSHGISTDELSCPRLTTDGNGPSVGAWRKRETLNTQRARIFTRQWLSHPNLASSRAIVITS
jgi:hypothetical protein